MSPCVCMCILASGSTPSTAWLALAVAGLHMRLRNTNPRPKHTMHVQMPAGWLLLGLPLRSILSWHAPWEAHVG